MNGVTVTETTISVSNLGPATRATIAGALGVQACRAALELQDRSWGCD